MAKELFDVFMVKRSHAVQGQTVTALFAYNDEDIGSLVLPFRAWVKLKRLLENGVAHDQREGNALKVKVKVQGLEEVPPLQNPPTPPVGQLRFVQAPTEGIPIIYTDDEDDPDIAAAEQQAKHDAAVEGRAATAEQLVQSLRGGDEE